MSYPGHCDLFIRGMLASVRDRNISFMYCAQMASRWVIDVLGELVAEYCYGPDHVIPEGIVDILLSNDKFTTHDGVVTYNSDWCNIGYFDGMRIEFYVGTPEERFLYLDKSSWLEFILSGYNEFVNTNSHAAVGHSDDTDHLVPNEIFEMVRREMLDAAVQM